LSSSEKLSTIIIAVLAFVQYKNILFSNWVKVLCSFVFSLKYPFIFVLFIPSSHFLFLLFLNSLLLLRLLFLLLSLDFAFSLDFSLSLDLSLLLVNSFSCHKNSACSKFLSFVSIYFLPFLLKIVNNVSFVDNCSFLL
jgi:hypothetical protein